MSYHNQNVPLADCTAQAMQDANQSYQTRKNLAHAHSQAPAVVLPKSFSHNPYVGVIPGTVDEMMRILESRRHQQTQMRRTYSSPNFFNSGLHTTPQSPLMGGSPVNQSAQFPRISSTPMFFEEPEVMSRNTSPTMMLGDSVTSFGESSTSQSFHQYPQGGNPPNNMNSSFPSSPNNQPNGQRLTNAQQRKQQKQQNRNLNGPSERRAMELPVPASVARQQQILLQQQQKQSPAHSKKQQHHANLQAEPSQRPKTPQQQAATSSVNSSTDSAGVITKVYQNGRPVPRMMEEGEMVDVPRPKVVIEAQDKTSAIAINFRNHTANYRTSRLRLCAGEYVVVDGDRGCDLGQVLHVVNIEASSMTDSTSGSVQRIASKDEVEKFHAMEAEELKALEFARVQATRHLNNKLTVEHVSFQFDRQKLTLWYKAAERVYFVPLLKALNQEYKCRIWMERIEDENTVFEDAVERAVEKKEAAETSEKKKEKKKE